MAVSDKRAKQVLWTIKLCILAIVAVLLIQVNRTMFVIRSANYLDQMQRVVGPFVSEERRLQLASSVALIKTKDDYQRVLKQLDEIVAAQKISAPERP
jgi:hypothetical protein